jgi:hypothetical protein
MNLKEKKKEFSNEYKKFFNKKIDKEVEKIYIKLCIKIYGPGSFFIKILNLILILSLEIKYFFEHIFLKFKCTIFYRKLLFFIKTGKFIKIKKLDSDYYKNEIEE